MDWVSRDASGYGASSPGQPSPFAECRAYWMALRRRRRSEQIFASPLCRYSLRPQSAFHNLHKFCLRAEDDDGFADMGEVRSVLDQNAGTLRHLTLGAHLQRTHSWDLAFESATLRALTHLDLVDTRISHAVLVRIMHASALRSLTLHGTFADPAAARVVFGSDHVIGGDHAVLPHLEAFRFVTVGHDDDWALFEAVAKFVGQRPRLRRLDLGSCPWELVRGVLPGLAGLRVLRVRIANLCTEAVDALIQAVPKTLLALHLNTVVSNAPLVRLPCR